MRNKVTLQEIKKVVTLGEYDSKLVATAINEQKQVSEFYPCELLFVVEGTHLEYSEIYLKVPGAMNMRISFESYKKKWHVSIDTREFKNISEHQKNELKKPLTEPQTMGVLTTKKIQGWVNYYTELYKIYVETNEANRVNVERELSEILADKDVKIMESGKRGFIRRNGIELEFNVYESYVSTQIKITPCSGYKNFVALADNKYISKH